MRFRSLPGGITKRAALVVLVLLLVAAATPGADWVTVITGAAPGTAPVVRTLSVDAHHTVLEVTVSGFWAEATPHGMKLRLPGYIVSTDHGRPELPMVGCTVALPQAGKPCVTVLSAHSLQPGRFRVRMAPELELDGQVHVPPAPVAPDRPYPENPVAVTHAGHWRDVPMATLQVHPFTASGDGTVIRVARRMVIQVRHPGRPVTWPSAAVPAEFTPVLESLAVNGAAVPTCPPQVDGPATEYLVISTATLASAVQPLLDWRHEQGYVTELVSTASSDPATIKDYIQTRYSQGRLKFVVLVGEHSHIPWYLWNSNLSDSWYACLTGGDDPDLYPDVGLGRLSGKNPGEITRQVQKILAYEKNPAAGAWFNRIILAAHMQGGAAGPYTTCCEDIARGPLASSGWTPIRQYGYWSSVDNTSLTSHVNQGVGIVLYRGHGGPTGWSMWCNIHPTSYTNNDVARLANGGMTPVVFSFCCLTGHFQDDTCFTEQWLRATHGAVACIGATEFSYTTGNTIMATEFCRAIFGDRTSNIYGFHAKGIARALALGGKGGENVAYLYCWMGDACTNLWLKAPDTLAVTHPSILVPGSQLVQVSVKKGISPVAGARVCLLKGAEVFAVENTGATGIATLQVAPATTGPVRVTVTARDCKPYQGSITVTQSGTARLSGTGSNRIGTRVALHLSAPGDSGLPYQVASSLGTGPVTVDTRSIWLDPDFVFLHSVHGRLPGIFVDYSGNLSPSGTAAAALALPAEPALVGVGVYSAFLTLNPRSPSGVKSISNPYGFRVQP